MTTKSTSSFSVPRASLVYRNRYQEDPRPNEFNRRPDKISFIENKIPNSRNILSMLESCAEVNRWANRGPLYHQLADRFSEHLNIPQDTSVTPCANCGIGLEALARLLSLHHGRKLRWVAPSFCFANIGRGYFSDVTFIDCDQGGVLSLNELSQLDPADYDGVILVNPFGIISNFDQYLNFAKEQNKELIIDNACGADTQIPNWPWQSFSLHQTKPYGVGEGGFVITGDAQAAPAEAGNFSVFQGMFEGSNTTAMKEMANMINLSRSYEANSKVIQAFDSRYGQTISSLSVT
jgi:dTDP-4-amino-4,6-dideoxygalactose transaminase